MLYIILKNNFQSQFDTFFGCLIVALFFGAIICVIAFLRHGAFSFDKKKFSKKYPIKSETIPLDHIFMEDKVLLKDIGECVYLGPFEGKRSFLKADDTTIVLSNEDVVELALYLKNDIGFKWQK